MVKKFILRLIEWLSYFIQDDMELMVFNLVYHVAQMAIEQGSWVEFAPVKGTCGNIKLTGNALPTFQYHVFDKSKMEFIKIRVEVSKPKRIEFVATIDATGHSDSKNHGNVVEVTKEYEAPFYILAWHLLRYFPYPRKSEALERHELTKKIQDESQGTGS